MPAGFTDVTGITASTHKLKSFVAFFKILTCLLISRPFGNIISLIMTDFRRHSKRLPNNYLVETIFDAFKSTSSSKPIAKTSVGTLKLTSPLSE